MDSLPDEAPPKPPNTVRTFLGRTLMVFFTIVAAGIAFETTCLAVTFASPYADGAVGGLGVGLIAALITAGTICRFFWVDRPPPTSRGPRME